jgi:hypothetical protein
MSRDPRHIPTRCLPHARARGRRPVHGVAAAVRSDRHGSHHSGRQVLAPHGFAWDDANTCAGAASAWILIRRSDLLDPPAPLEPKHHRQR